jgi:hypothetical protein
MVNTQLSRLAPCPNCKSNQRLEYCWGELGEENALSVSCECGVHGPYIMADLYPGASDDESDTAKEFRADMAWNKFVKQYSVRPGLELDRGKILGLKTALRILTENQDVPLQARLGMIHGLISALDGTAQPIFTNFDNLYLDTCSDPED